MRDRGPPRKQAFKSRLPISIAMNSALSINVPRKWLSLLVEQVPGTMLRLASWTIIVPEYGTGGSFFHSSMMYRESTMIIMEIVRPE
jgi:hypothetical protein